MKKLSLKNLKLDSNDMLQRNQLKSVFGGNGGHNTCAQYGYNSGNYNFAAGNGYGGCECVSAAAALNGAIINGTKRVYNPNC
jgi:hypothetical protein